jgi:nicotinamidase-related amidase
MKNLNGILGLTMMLLAADCATHPAPKTLRAMYGAKRATEISAPHTALVFVDYQQEFVSGGLPLPDAPLAIAKAEKLLHWARENGLFIVHVRNIVTPPNSPLFRPDSPASEFIPSLGPTKDELVVTKSMAGGFSKTNLESVLRSHGITQVIVAGFMSHLAVDTTARDAMVLGFLPIVAGDATATRDLPGIDRHELKKAAFAMLEDRFADVMTVDEIGALPVKR